MYKILIAEDDAIIAGSIANHLGAWGYDTAIVEDFKDITDLFLKYSPELVLMDISLPFVNGYYWCSEIRKLSKVPIVFISSASDNLNIVMAMNMGADDFISKPFDLGVLCAKVGALLRRTYSFAGQVNVIERHGVMLNLGDAVLTYKDHKLDLTKNDFRILQKLLEHGGQVVSREEIMINLWESDCFIDDNTLTVNVTRLRKKLESIGLGDFITTKKGLGYMIL